MTKNYRARRMQSSSLELLMKKKPHQAPEILNSRLHPPIILPLSSHHFRIVSVLFPYRSRINPVSEYGNNTETIRKQYGIDTGMIRERYENDGRNIEGTREKQNSVFSFFTLCEVVYE